MTWSQQLMKVNNKQAILETILKRAPISRADISQHLGLTKGTVSSLVNELLEANLCIESGPGESSGGRRPVLLLFQEKAGYSIGIDLGVNYMLGILTDLNGDIIGEISRNTNNANYQETFDRMKEMIQSLIKTAPESYYGVVGIGIGIPGIVNNKGEILLAPNLGWKNVGLKKDMEEEFGLPVIIENEANAGAYGEKKFGAGKGHEHLVYVSAGMGIGVGIILQNELYRGANGFSGEMGHMIIDVHGKPCKCGSKGCWELYASEKALIERASSLFQLEETTLESLVDQASHNEGIRDLFKEIGQYLGIGISNISNTFNPQQIIIGNRLAMAKDWLRDSIVKVVESHALQFNQEKLHISFSDLSSYSPSLGVSAHVIENFLKTNLNHIN
ncbi:ROK family protein [Peribacillus sp. NPDC097206]|uniref:ROK family transcriptional regulator n=1 Tax=unclassified Peribacillus TaxID=2675266 RepID=UPI003811A9FF